MNTVANYKYRYYFFGNMYLSSIQQGIQAAHTVAEMFIKYQLTSNQREILYHWALDNKTMILLNAGSNDELRKLIIHFSHRDNPYPWTCFHEDQQSLDGVLTGVACVLPNFIYETTSTTCNENFLSNSLWIPIFSTTETSWDIETKDLIKLYSLSR